MKITLENIGVLKHAELDLSKDLIILCGPNNTGKTYAAYTVYAMNRYAFGDELRQMQLMPIIKYEEGSSFENGTIKIDIFNHFLMNEKDLYSLFYSDYLNNVLYSIFDSSINLFENSKLCIVYNQDYIRERLYSDYVEQSQIYGSIIVEFKKAIEDPYLFITIIIRQTDPITPQQKRVIEFEIIQNFLIDLIFKNIYKHAYIAPAERIAINLFSRQLSVQRNKLVDDLLFFNMRGASGTSGILSREKRYPLPIRDSLEIAERLTEYQKERTEFRELADIFESEILGGKISVSEYGEVQYRPDNSDIKPLGIHLSASMVKSLSSLVFYFRHMARKGDFIIIDEPELNLHPDNQRKVARILARIVNAGFKVMISTHSDYIIRELNNLIMLNQGNETAEKLIVKYKYKKEELIDCNRVGAYLFRDKKSEEIEVSESGFEVETIDEEISNLNTTSEDIYFSLH